MTFGLEGARSQVREPPSHARPLRVVEETVISRIVM